MPSEGSDAGSETDDEIGDDTSTDTDPGTTSTESESSTETETSETAETDSSETTETETETDTTDTDTTDTGFEGNPLFDPECSEWIPTKVRARGLDSVWTDGVDIVAGGDVDLVVREAGGWIDTDDIALPTQVGPITRVWGPPNALWLLARDGETHWGVYTFDGSGLSEAHAFTPVVGSEGLDLALLTGASPDAVWAAATPICGGIGCQIDPMCSCEQTPSELVFFDGDTWTDTDAPFQARALWTDGDAVVAVGEGLSGDAGGVAYRIEGGEWVEESIPNLDSLRSLGGVDADDLWAGGLDGALARRVQGSWQDYGLPTSDTIIRVAAVDAAEVYALGDGGELWRFDGVSWSLWLEQAKLRDVGVLDDGLVGVGVDSLFDDGHLVAHIDTSDASLTPLYTREDAFGPTAFVIDSMDSVVGSDRFPHLNWRFDGVSWAPTYEGFNQGFSGLLGAVDEGFGWVSGVPSLGQAVWQISGGEVLAHPDPVDNTAVYTGADLVERDGETQLWIVGRDLSDQSAMVHQLSGGQWFDRTPASPEADSAGRLAHAGGRVFAVLSSSNPITLDIVYSDTDGEWLPIDHGFEWIDHLMATDPEQLWLTGYTSEPEGNQLYGWDGSQWRRVDEDWPEFAGVGDWQRLIRHTDAAAWALTSRLDASEQLAFWDGSDWALVDTPAQLHGWDNPRSNRIAAGPDGLIIHDGLRRWRFEFCPE